MEQQIEELEAVYDGGPPRPGGRYRPHIGIGAPPRAGTAAGARRHATPRSRARRGGGGESVRERGRRRAQLGAARERAEHLAALMQPHEDLMPDAEGGGAPSEYERQMFLYQCDEIIRLCQLTRSIGDDELEAIAALAEARYQEEQAELAKDREQLREQREADHWAWEQEGSAEPEPEPGDEPQGWEEDEDWRAEAHERRLGVATTSSAQQRRKGGGAGARKKKASPRRGGSDRRISARQLKRDQEAEAKRAVKRAAEAEADVVRQAAWRARLAASTARAPGSGRGVAHYDYGGWGGGGAPLRSAPRAQLSAADAMRQREQQLLRNQQQQEQVIDAEALGVDAATARLLRELQFREVKNHVGSLMFTTRLTQTVAANRLARRTTSFSGGSTSRWRSRPPSSARLPRSAASLWW